MRGLSPGGIASWKGPAGRGADGVAGFQAPGRCMKALALTPRRYSRTSEPAHPEEPTP